MTASHVNSMQQTVFVSPVTVIVTRLTNFMLNTVIIILYLTIYATVVHGVVAILSTACRWPWRVSDLAVCLTE